eukprot:CAMPEP_0167813838 /NCGR_PEP_ID=MMETSP0112_2-20121227/2077_1 /TAXON_ID=91324 /ORGANISM="Lotharella globosa, Strain CCCM811" /LENGTH=138 /DNA_ID=CAMNT_0007712967 /DNA_START=409 /DNA_END=825 /DNA_ORIENTATION=+
MGMDVLADLAEPIRCGPIESPVHVLPLGRGGAVGTPGVVLVVSRFIPGKIFEVVGEFLGFREVSGTDEGVLGDKLIHVVTSDVHGNNPCHERLVKLLSDPVFFVTILQSQMELILAHELSLIASPKALLVSIATVASP